jgi:hypothetical protein
MGDHHCISLGDWGGQFGERVGTSEVDGNNVLAALRCIELRMGNMVNTYEYERDRNQGVNGGWAKAD